MGRITKDLPVPSIDRLRGIGVETGLRQAETNGTRGRSRMPEDPGETGASKDGRPKTTGGMVAS